MKERILNSCGIFKPKKVYKIKQTSNKMAVRRQLYSIVRNEFLAKNTTCQCVDKEASANCSYEATTVHHKKGREGDLLIASEHFMALCMPCHRWVEDNPAKAKELGYSLSRLAK